MHQFTEVFLGGGFAPNWFDGGFTIHAEMPSSFGIFVYNKNTSRVARIVSCGRFFYLANFPVKVRGVRAVARVIR